MKIQFILFEKLKIGVRMEDVWVRFWSALVAVILSLASFYSGGVLLPFTWWCTVHSLMIYELVSIIESYSISTLSTVMACHFFFFEFTFKAFGYPPEVMVMIAFLPFVISVLDPWRDFRAMAVMSTAYLWISYPCSIGLTLSSQPSFMVGFLNVVWFTDAGAYFCGKLFGRTPLLISISPKKSCEGTIGALIVAQIVAQIVAIWVTNISRHEWMEIALIASIMGQLGDLFESFMKRHFSVKDSGGVMPGHGGMLDRFDAVLFALVFVQAHMVVRGIEIRS